MTQEDLAATVGVSDRTIRNIESGRNGPTLETIGKLAEALGAGVGVLFEVSEG